MIFDVMQQAYARSCGVVFCSDLCEIIAEFFGKNHIDENIFPTSCSTNFNNSFPVESIVILNFDEVLLVQESYNR